MRMLLIVAMVAVFGWNAHAMSKGENKSKLVKQYVLKYYPGARLISKKRITEELYHVHLIQADRSLYIDITISGEVLFEEKEMLWKELPPFVKKSFTTEEEQQFDYGIQIVFEDGSVFYFIELFEGGGTGTYLFDEQGNLLRRDFI